MLSARGVTARTLGIAAALAVLAGVSVLLVVTGPGAVAAPPTAARVLRTALVLVIPGVTLAWSATRVTRPVRLLLAWAGAAAVTATALWTWDGGGAVLLPAALLLVGAGAVRRPAGPATPSGTTPATATTPATSPARPDIVVAAAGAAAGGLVGRAVTLDDVAGLPATLNVVVAGLLLLAWPLAAVVLLPATRRSRVVVAIAAVVMAAIILRTPAGGETWLAPATVLLLAAAVVPTTATTATFRPRSRRLPAGSRAGGAVAAAVLVAIGVLTTPDLARGGGDLRLVSGRVGDAQQAIGVADLRFLADVARLEVITPGARCYFLREGAEVYADEVACGPVAAETGTGTWNVYPVRAGFGLLQVVGGSTSGQQVDLARLHRPDGLQPAAGGPGEGDAPAPAATRDLVTVLHEDPPEAEPGEGFVLAGRTEVAVDAVASPATVNDDSGREVAPPAGFRFVAVQLRFEADGAPAGITLELVDGPHRVDLTAAISSDGSYYADGWVVAAEPDDDVDPTLDVTYRGHTERLDLGRGERTEERPLLYEPLARELGQEVPEADVPVAIPVPAPHTATAGLDGYTVTGVELTAFEENRGWAPEGRAWLVVTIDDLFGPHLTGADLGDVGDVGDVGAYFRFDPRGSFSLRSADGATVELEGAGPDPDGGTAVVFAVPEDVRSVVLRCAPRWILTVGDHELDVTAPATEIPIDL